MYHPRALTCQACGKRLVLGGIRTYKGSGTRKLCCTECFRKLVDQDVTDGKRERKLIRKSKADREELPF